METEEFTDIRNCDVLDIELLAIYRYKRKYWFRLMYEGPESIYQQIGHLLYNDAVFRMYNETRRISAQSNNSSLGINYSVTKLFDLGFFTSQVMAIRRISDNHFDNPQKAVVSLPTIIQDMQRNIGLFTRENHICHDGAKYVYEEDSDISRFVHKQLHENYDFLSDVSKENRSRNDSLNEQIFKNLNRELKKLGDIRTLVNKHFAHMSDRVGKRNLTENQQTISLDRLDDAYKAIIRVAQLIGTKILYGNSMPGIANPQFDILENLDKPIVSEQDLVDINELWRKRKQEVDSWDAFHQSLV